MKKTFYAFFKLEIDHTSSIKEIEELSKCIMKETSAALKQDKYLSTFFLREETTELQNKKHTSFKTLLSSIIFKFVSTQITNCKKDAKLKKKEGSKRNRDDCQKYVATEDKELYDVSSVEYENYRKLLRTEKVRVHKSRIIDDSGAIEVFISGLEEL